LLKQPVTLRLDRDSVAYFKKLATKDRRAYQQLINLYLRDCAVNRRDWPCNGRSEARDWVIGQTFRFNVE